MSYESDIPDDLSILNVETPNQGLLRNEFAALAQQNQNTIDEFEPAGAIAETPIILHTSFDELEEAEPTLANAFQSSMLRGFGLQSFLSDVADTTALFSHNYDDGMRLEIKPLARADGAQIPVEVLSVKLDTHGRSPVEVHLLSNEAAEQKVARLERDIEEQKLDHRLQKDFGLDSMFTAQAGLSFSDKKGMLAAFDELAEIETVIPDLNALNGLRQKLVKAIHPATEMVGAHRKPKRAVLTKKYVDSVNQLIDSHGASGSTANEIIQRERLLRLSLLNKQLTARKRAAWLGAIGNSAFVATMIGGVGYGGTAIAHEAGMLPGFIKPWEAGLLGPLEGILVAAPQVKRLRERRKYVSEFEPTGYHTDLLSQLADEQRIARQNYLMTTRYPAQSQLEH